MQCRKENEDNDKYSEDNVCVCMRRKISVEGIEFARTHTHTQRQSEKEWDSCAVCSVKASLLAWREILWLNCVIGICSVLFFACCFLLTREINLALLLCSFFFLFFLIQRQMFLHMLREQIHAFISCGVIRQGFASAIMLLLSLCKRQFNSMQSWKHSIVSFLSIGNLWNAELCDAIQLGPTVDKIILIAIPVPEFSI